MRRCVASASPVDGGGRRVGGVRGPAACSGAVATPRRAGADRAVRPFQDRCRRLRRVRSPGGGADVCRRHWCPTPRRVWGTAGDGLDRFSCCGARHCLPKPRLRNRSQGRPRTASSPSGGLPYAVHARRDRRVRPIRRRRDPYRHRHSSARDARRKRRGRSSSSRCWRSSWCRSWPCSRRCRWCGGGGELAGRGADGGDVLHRLPRHHDRLPPVLHARFVQGEASAADRAGRDGFAGGGGAPGAVGGRSPQAPQVLGRGG
ncbi:hypothetical protein SMICM304S_10391 [Streptomyces microflavus]